MTAINLLWLLLGAGAGALHAYMLWRASQPRVGGPSGHGIRLLLIGGVLVASAVFGGILPAATGWGIGYFSTVGIVAVRSRA